MRLLALGIVLPLVFGLDAPPFSKRLLEDADLLRRPRFRPRMPGIAPNSRVNGVLQNEVKDLVKTNDKFVDDDYSDFNNEPVKNGGANHHLKPVTYSPIPKRYNIPRPDPEDKSSDIGKVPTTTVITGTQQRPQYFVPQRPVPRQGYYYQHYPYYNLPRQFRLRPRYPYTYPPQYQHVQYTYHHPLPYEDHYSIYRNDPRFNPYATAVAGCGPRGCGGGCGGQQGGCGGSGGCSGGDGCDLEDEDEEEASFEDDKGEDKSGDQINKKDPLDDIDLEDLEKLEKAPASSERRLAPTTQRSPPRARGFKQ
ncbi:hypothetical protein Q1695_014550 [Nippostrongylus brasiliensis]|nr:hypothetical protein Q1695_014550 [Nippostrongylus brasiliensis]